MGATLVDPGSWVGDVPVLVGGVNDGVSEGPVGGGSDVLWPPVPVGKVGVGGVSVGDVTVGVSVGDVTVGVSVGDVTVGVSVGPVGVGSVVVPWPPVPVGDVMVVGGTSVCDGPTVVSSGPVGVGSAGVVVWPPVPVGVVMGSFGDVAGSVGVVAGSVGKVSVGRTSVGRTSVGRADVGKTSVGKTSVGRADVGKTSVGKTSVGRTSVGRTSVGRADVGKTSVGKTSVGRTSVGNTSVGKTSVGRTSVGSSVEAVTEGSVGKGASAVVVGSLIPVEGPFTPSDVVSGVVVGSGSGVGVGSSAVDISEMMLLRIGTIPASAVVVGDSSVPSVLEAVIIPEGPNSIPVVPAADVSSLVAASVVVGKTTTGGITPVDAIRESSIAATLEFSEAVVGDAEDGVSVTTTVVVPSSGVVVGCVSVVPKSPPVVNPLRKSDKSRLVVPADEVNGDEKIS